MLRQQIVELINSFPLYLALAFALWIAAACKNGELNLNRGSICIHQFSFRTRKSIKFTSLYRRVGRDKIRNQEFATSNMECVRAEVRWSGAKRLFMHAKCIFALPVPLSTIVMNMWALSSEHNKNFAWFILWVDLVWARVYLTVLFSAETSFAQLSLKHHSFAIFFFTFTTWWSVTRNKYSLGSVVRFRGRRFTKLYRSQVVAVGNWMKPAQLADSRQTENEFGHKFGGMMANIVSVIHTMPRHSASNFMGPPSSEATDWARKTLCANICTSRPIYLRCVSFLVAAKNFVCINK